MQRTVLMANAILVLVLGSLIIGCSGDNNTAEETPDSFIDKLESTAMKTELDDMRLAMTAVMAVNGIEEIVSQATWTNSAMEFKCNSCADMLSDMLQGMTLGFYYQWDSEGNVYQCKDTDCPDPF